LQNLSDAERKAALRDCRGLKDAIEELKLGAQWGELNSSMTDAAQAYLDLGKTLRACHDFGGARQALSKSLLANPKYQAAQDELKSLAAENRTAKK
jgi:hypothetical protein